VLFVTLAGAETGRDPGDDSILGAELTARLRAALRAQLPPRHVPGEIIQVPGVSRTLSGKKLEIPDRKILLGTPVAAAADPSALAHPEVPKLLVRGSRL
jgi:acetoacetyl-CoA synthetase